jgi:hypothetical protein
MKPPFSGSFHDCGNRWTEPSGNIGYSKGTIAWSEAQKLVCDKFSTDTGRPCSGPYDRPLFTVMRRDDDGRLYYVVAQRGCLRGESKCGAGDYDNLIYRVDAVGGGVTVLQRTSEDPDAHQWTKPGHSR